jgi:hypothetical protein
VRWFKLSSGAKFRLSLRALMALVAVVTVGLAPFAWKARTAWRRQAELEAIREAALRDLLQADHSRINFLSFDQGEDPTDAFLAQLADIPCSLRKGSKAIMSKGKADPMLGQIRDRATGETGILVTIRVVDWAGEDEVDVLVSTERGVLNGSAYSCRWKNQSGQWKPRSRSASLQF